MRGGAFYDGDSLILVAAGLCLRFTTGKVASLAPCPALERRRRVSIVGFLQQPHSPAACSGASASRMRSMPHRGTVPAPNGPPGPTGRAEGAPNGTATFTGNVPTSLTISNNTSINTIQFNAGAPAYQFTIEQPTSANFLITGTGIVNSSANAPTFIDNFYMDFLNGSSAGNANITNNSSGTLHFDNTSTAGNAIITNNSTLEFDGSSTAGNATITTNNVVLGRVVFNNNSTAGNAQFITNAGGYVDFSNTSGPGGNHQVSAGSIAGAGNYFLGANRLTVGTNDLSTAVSGAISDGGLAGGAGASLVKVGTGTLTLTGTNTYTGATRPSAAARWKSMARSPIRRALGKRRRNALGHRRSIRATTTIMGGGKLAPGKAGPTGCADDHRQSRLPVGCAFSGAVTPADAPMSAVSGAGRRRHGERDFSGGSYCRSSTRSSPRPAASAAPSPA